MKFTAQQTFNKISKHLLTQLEVSATNQQCLYRMNSGLQCAVGCLIPDDQYYGALEGNSVEHIVGQVPALQFHDFYTMTQLQLLHDDAWNKKRIGERWSDALVQYAGVNNLSTRWISTLLYPQEQ